MVDKEQLNEFVLVYSVAIALLFGVAFGGAGGYWIRGHVEAYKTWLKEPIVEGEVPPPLSVGVQDGENFWSIAREFYNPDKYNTGNVVKVIEKMNPELDPYRLKRGDRVVLPRYDEL